MSVYTYEIHTIISTPCDSKHETGRPLELMDTFCILFATTASKLGLSQSDPPHICFYSNTLKLFYLSGERVTWFRTYMHFSTPLNFSILLMPHTHHAWLWLHMALYHSVMILLAVDREWLESSTFTFSFCQKKQKQTHQIKGVMPYVSLQGVVVAFSSFHIYCCADRYCNNSIVNNYTVQSMYSVYIKVNCIIVILSVRNVEKPLR